MDLSYSRQTSRFLSIWGIIFPFCAPARATLRVAPDTVRRLQMRWQSESCDCTRWYFALTILHSALSALSRASLLARGAMVRAAVRARAHLPAVRD